VVRSSPPNIWVSPGPVAVHGCPFWAQKTGLNQILKHCICLPSEEEKELSKNWAEVSVCPEWRGGYLTADGTKFAFYERPGLHGDAWFDKNKDYSADCQVNILFKAVNYAHLSYDLGCQLIA
jgi:hypothetical protein